MWPKHHGLYVPFFNFTLKVDSKQKMCNDWDAVSLVDAIWSHDGVNVYKSPMHHQIMSVIAIDLGDVCLVLLYIFLCHFINSLLVYQIPTSVNQKVSLSKSEVSIYIPEYRINIIELVSRLKTFSDIIQIWSGMQVLVTMSTVSQLFAPKILWASK